MEMAKTICSNRLQKKINIWKYLKRKTFHTDVVWSFLLECTSSEKQPVKLAKQTTSKSLEQLFLLGGEKTTMKAIVVFP